MTDQEAVLATIEINGGSAAAILSGSRLARVVSQRRSLVHALKAVGWSTGRIGRAIGRDHTTVLALLKTKPAAKWVAHSSTGLDMLVAVEMARALGPMIFEEFGTSTKASVDWAKRIAKSREELFEAAAVRHAKKIADPMAFGALGVEVSLGGITRRYAMRSVERFGKRCWEISTRVD